MTRSLPSRARAAAALVLAVAGTAQSASLRAKRKELDRVHAQLELKKKEIQAYQQMQRQVEQDLTRMEKEKEMSQRQMRELESERLQTESKKRELSEELGALSLASGQGRRLLSGELDAYNRGLEAQSDLYDSSDLWAEAFRQAAMKEKVRYLERLDAFTHRTEAVHAQVRIKDRQIKKRTLAALIQMRERESHYRRSQEVYRETEQKLTHTLREIHELEDTKRALASLIDGLKRRKAPHRGPAAELPFPRHSLPWPVEGRVVQGFGRELVPKLNTWVIHNGITLEAAPASKVRPVSSGKVIFAGPFRSYGRVMIIEHEAFYSIYGQLDQFLSNQGDRVTTSTQIATLASGSKGAVLYLEIRRGSAALDPLAWLQRR